MPDLRSSVRQGRLKCRGKAIFSRMADSTRFAIVSLVCSLNVTPDFDEIERSSGSVLEIRTTESPKPVDLDSLNRGI